MIAALTNDKLNIENVINYYTNKQTQFILEQLLVQVWTFFDKNPTLQESPFPIVHSLKSRIKDPEHLKDKLIRKLQKGIIITSDNLFNENTDLIGVRILHLHQEQFKFIHKEIMKKVNQKEWILAEPPKAYTWDPESQNFYETLGINTVVKDSFYTSVHYLIKLNNGNSLCCEIQVRTLFEEIWGEIDHAINYPHPIESIACSEQLKVLSKLVSTGTRLSDSIFKSYNEFNSNNKKIEEEYKKE